MRAGDLTAGHPGEGHLSLPAVTLVAATSVALAQTARAMIACLDRVAFGDAIWCSDQPPPPALAGRVRWHVIEPLESRDDYSQFVLTGLGLCVATSHVLLVQWDGYVIAPEAWDAAFLDHDYVGAVWPQFRDGYDVGNGGFTLRSRRLLEICSGLTGRRGEAEDTFICRTMRPVLEREHGMSFAPAALAQRFSYERRRCAEPSFGFHGAFNLVELVSDREAARIIADLPPNAMAPGELREILGWAVRRLRWRLALEVAGRWRRWL